VTRTTRWVTVLTVAASIIVAGATSAASASSHANASKAAAHAARSALRLITSRPPATNQAIPGSRRSVHGLTQFESGNWSGYANDNTKGNSYRQVSGVWTEPAISCPTQELELSVFWVGIDGFSSDTVEQDGTLAECYEGTAYYYTWWEMYPSNDIQTVGDTVRPGDKIVSSVVKQGTNYRLRVTDFSTSGNNIDTTQSCDAATCVDSSAEWIGEAPSGGRGEFPLAKFTPWSVSGASVSSGAKTGTIKSFPDDEITMEGDAYPLATPGALNSAGTTFKDYWNNSY
jgi:peptidase A4-like protein